jgi:uncharacterized membrane protein YebE (DUF533 family)
MIKTSQIFAFLDKKAAINVDADSSHPKISVPKDNFLHWLPNFDKKDKELIVNVHGGGTTHSYVIGDAEGTNKATENYFFGTHQQGKEMEEAIKKLREKDIHSVHSFACNADGGGRPEFYEKLLGKDLDDVTMTPAGHVGVFGQQFSHGVAKLYNGLNYITGGHQTYAAPQHHYHKVKDHFLGIPTGSHWEDQGEYYPLVDRIAGNRWVQAGVGVGMAGLAYGLYKKYKSKKKLDAIKDKVLSKKASGIEAVHEGHSIAEMAQHAAHLGHNIHSGLEAPATAAKIMSKVAPATEGTTGILSKLAPVTKGLNTVSNALKPITHNPAFETAGKWAYPVTSALDGVTTLTKGPQKAFNEQQDYYSKPMEHGIIKTPLNIARTGLHAMSHPVSTLGAIGGMASDMYHNVGDINESNRTRTEGQQAMQQLQQQHEQRWTRENQAIINSPAYAQNNPNNLSPDKWRQQANQPDSNFDVRQDGVHFVQNTNGMPANNFLLAKHNQLPREEMVVQQPTPPPNIAQNRPIPNPGLASKTQSPAPMISGPAPTTKPTLGSPALAGPDHGGGAPGSDPNIGKKLLASK